MLNELEDLISSFLKKNDPQLFEKSKQYPLIIKFSAIWCGPCRQLQKKIDELKEKRSLPFLEIDVEKYPSLAQKFNVTSIPALFLFYQEKLKKDNEVWEEIRKEFSHLSLLEQLKEFIKI